MEEQNQVPLTPPAPRFRPHAFSLNWKAPEYFHYERAGDWYWAVGVIAVSLAVLCILFDNVLLGILILLAAATGMLHTRREPKEVEVDISSRGIRLEKTLYPFDTLESFWIEEERAHPRILVKSTKTLMPYIVVPIDPEVPFEEIREYLLHYIKEVEHHESIAHQFLEYLGF